MKLADIARRLTFLARELRQLSDALLEQPGQAAHGNYLAIEEAILGLLAEARTPLPYSEIGPLLRLKPDSYLRSILADLKRRGFLIHVTYPKNGYFLATRENDLPKQPVRAEPAKAPWVAEVHGPDPRLVGLAVRATPAEEAALSAEEINARLDGTKGNGRKST